MLQKRFALLLLLLFSLVALCCTSNTRQARIQPPPPQADSQSSKQTGEPDNFSVVLNRARENTRSDNFTKAFAVAAKFSLPGEQIKNLNQFRVGRDGTISIIDFERKQAETYDSAGRFQRPIGAAGNAPGAHVWPSDLTETDAQQVAVSDFQAHRVNVFANDGKFLSSFIYTPQNFSAQRVFYDEGTRSYYLYGNRWQRDESGQISGAELIHKYSSEGDFIGSYLPFPDWAKTLDLYNYDYPAADISQGNLFVALPFDYTVYRLTPQGELSTYLKADTNTFKPPTKVMEVKKRQPSEAYNYAQNWRLTWTPINNLVVEGDTMLVQYQTFSPLRYTIDVWSLANKKKLTTINTNYAILSKGQDGYLYFLENLEAKGQDRYDIIRAKLKQS